MDPAFIQHSWTLLVFTWTCLVAEEWEMISPLSLHTLWKGLQKFLGFFCIVSPKALQEKSSTLNRAQRRKFMPWVTSLNQIHTALTYLMLNPLIINTARFVYLVGPQFCNSLSLTLGLHTATDSHRSKDWNDLFQTNQHYPLTLVTKSCVIPLQSPAWLRYTNYNLAVWYSSCRKKRVK